ncbi:uncharacterized protein LOC103569892 [Microplitis demolitor]|uniref:uncharacterized protein LOC103569892 n=1 Tax=Microplitis demolitor TaxID=69319 RepID=UPI0004CCA935|nr:uncharacterized protein LOC103569892 [Microplitis demolitor]XP_053598233.1 uncharacterized protein LOC103569892 [Microplitis demolitor]
MKFNERRQLWILLMIACIAEATEEGISCYKCTVAPLRGAPEASSQICSQFKQNHHFQVYCPKSTMCMKRTIYHKLVNGSIINTSVERDCASQLDIFQAYDYNERQWRQQEEIVQGAYPESCFTGEDRGSPGGPPEYCFCKYNLCNDSNVNRQIYTLIIIPFMILILNGSVAI